ncbi:hypothetical protein CHS0354_024721 [Potamilus streckersoni]|uniref:Uncharacterized protein n=1 Tax=Potamilus streckersoni TaxID=2493646 RepID=A0AAE0RWY2_9BIVA|nr:hypothetical protein CHS0354_024721 [Potamilus streckersoni]
MAFKKDIPVIVAAIDFGTAYSGIAFQFKHEFEKDPTKISAPQAWNGGKEHLISYKTPTCLLLDKDGKIHSFGYQAEDKYADLCIEGKHTDWYFFRRFKMRLHEREGLTKSSELEDASKKKMKTIDVFSKSIECLTKVLMEMLDRQGVLVSSTEIHWVLTVPAIWNEPSKQFMREAAIMAGIKSNQLDIALEPEAAALYCQYLPLDRFVDKEDEVRFGALPPGSTYMVVDLGGGTADMTVHQKTKGNQLKEVVKASGGPWGGTAVEDKFLGTLEDIIGKGAMEVFRKQYTYDYFDLLREFESVKRKISMKTEDKLTIKKPVALDNVSEGNSFKALLENSKYSQDILVHLDKLRISPDFVRKLFQHVTDKIIKHIEVIFSSCETVTLILLVGGMSESLFVQDIIRSRFHGKNGIKVITPKEAGLSVLKGAVIFGRSPEVIETRVLRYTYGVSTTPEFDPEEHPEEKKIEIDGKIRCKDVFNAFIRVNTPVEMGHSVTECYSTIVPFQTAIILQVFSSSDPEPKFTTDPGCLKVGELAVFIPNPSEEERAVIVVFNFGYTELQVLAFEARTMIPFITSLKMNE